MSSAIDQLARQLGSDWPHLREARRLSIEVRDSLKAVLSGKDSADTSIVVSGSLARDEFTSGSDIDWTLLIDGSSDPRHYDYSTEIGRVISEIARKPTGREGTFSTLVFSHDLIHDIGGESDTNRNTTRRLLLLLESRCVGRQEAYQRVVRNILSRYLLEDRGFWKETSNRVPRFLQNDFARYWRTLAVDFAYKLRARDRKGWAIRNLKLRMSRKLIYVSGLLSCYRCHFEVPREEWMGLIDDQERQQKVIGKFEAFFRETPLEIVASMLLNRPELVDPARTLFHSYDQFLGILSDQDQRDHLERLDEEDAEEDPAYQAARRISHEFRDSVLAIFFNSESVFAPLTRVYGVF